MSRPTHYSQVPVRQKILDYDILVEAMETLPRSWPNLAWKQFLLTADPHSHDPADPSSYSVLATVVIDAFKWNHALDGKRFLLFVRDLISTLRFKVDQRSARPELPAFFTELISNPMKY